MVPATCVPCPFGSHGDVQVGSFASQSRVGNEEVLEKRDAALTGHSTEPSPIAEVVDRRDARIEDRDADTRASQTHHLPGEERAALNACPEVEGLDDAVDAGEGDAGLLAITCSSALGTSSTITVDEIEPARTRVLAELCGKFRALHAHDHAGDVLGRRADAARRFSSPSSFGKRLPWPA